MSSPNENNSTSQGSARDNIKHVIVLMFENRSFDHLLGAMPGVDGLPPAVLKVATEIAPSPAHSEEDYMKHDFNHDFSGMIQDLYGTGTTGIIKGHPIPPKTPLETNNPEFFKEVNKKHEKDSKVVSYFKWGSMQVFHTLAENFVVCDNWYCDMPGHTKPNRAFMHCATTGDLGIDDNDAGSSSFMVNSPTIFEQIQQNGQTWKMYWPGPVSECDTDFLNQKVFNQQYKPQNPTQYNVTQVPIANFFMDLEIGTLPLYSFIMCWWPSSGFDTSMHPAHPVEYGENFLACIYNALRASPCWGNTLLIVNFDENGGIYDHKPVPQTTPPDENAPISYWPLGSNPKYYSFDFRVLGLRIPVLLISPWLKKNGICSDQYQNTSILRFLQDLLPNENPSKPYFLTQRDKNAPSIAPVFTEFGCSDMRDDCPSNIPGYTNGPYGSTLMNTPTEEDLAAVPTSDRVDRTKDYVGGLPGHADSGKPITRNFATVGELLTYAQERRDAAIAYFKAEESQE